jgi:hypothetical protein
LLVVRTYAIEIGNFLSNWSGYKIFVQCEIDGMKNIQKLSRDVVVSSNNTI